MKWLLLRFETDLSIFRRGLLLVGIPCITGTIFTMALYLVILQTDKEVQDGQLYKTAEQLSAEALLTAYHAGWDATRIFRDAEFSRLDNFVADLRQLVALRNKSCAVDGAQFAGIRTVMTENLKLYARMLKPVFARDRNLKAMLGSNLDSQRQDLSESIRRAREMMQVLLKMSRSDLVDSNLQAQANLRLVQAIILLCGLVASVVVAIFLAWLFMRGIVRRLEAVKTNTQRLAGNLPLRPRLVGRDEIAVVDGALHDMAAALAETARREAALFENASDVICVLDEYGSFSRANPATKVIWKYNPHDLLGRSLVDLVAGEHQALVAKALADARQAGGAYEFECLICSRKMAIR